MNPEDMIAQLSTRDQRTSKQSPHGDETLNLYSNETPVRQPDLSESSSLNTNLPMQHGFSVTGIGSSSTKEGPKNIATSSTVTLAKRATYDPRIIAPLHASSGSATISTLEYTIHPSIAAYQHAHPRRSLINFGPYILLQTLGEGEFGKVKLGVHKDYGEEVAVKLIRRGSVDNNMRLTKVEREIDVLKVRKVLD
jgi:hypothetical protein